jgi:uncharacterized protein (DUF58 family)
VNESSDREIAAASTTDAAATGPGTAPAARSALRGAAPGERFPGVVTPEMLVRLASLGLRARTIVEGFVSGLHRSPFHGFSVEFSEHREYTPGDDLRYVDWKVFAKSDRYYLKQFEEETNFACHILVDISDSMRYRSDGAVLSKLDYAVSLGAALAYLVLRQQDGVGLFTFDRQLRAQLRPSSQSSQFEQCVTTFDALEPARVLQWDEVPEVSSDDSAQSGARETPWFELLLRRVAQQIRRRGLIVLLSDLFDEPAAIVRGLRQLRHGRHDVIVVQVLDRAEAEFPFEEPTLFRGLEGLGERRVEPRSLRDAYRAEFARSQRELHRAVRGLGMDCLIAYTDEPLDGCLFRLLTRSESASGGRTP